MLCTVLQCHPVLGLGPSLEARSQPGPSASRPCPSYKVHWDSRGAERVLGCVGSLEAVVCPWVRCLWRLVLGGVGCRDVEGPSFTWTVQLLFWEDEIHMSSAPGSKVGLEGISDLVRYPSPLRVLLSILITGLLDGPTSGELGPLSKGFPHPQQYCFPL